MCFGEVHRRRFGIQDQQNERAIGFISSNEPRLIGISTLFASYLKISQSSNCLNYLLQMHWMWLEREYIDLDLLSNKGLLIFKA